MIFRANRKKYRVPPGIRVYAVGDVHGRADLLEQVFTRIDSHRTLRPSAQVMEVFLGDYIDRGPSSRDVIDKLISRAATREVICLRGNHEVFLEEFFRDTRTISEWKRFGGLETLSSYGLRDAVSQIDILSYAIDLAIPSRHRAFLTNLRPSFTCGDFFFVHAGVRPGVSLASQRLEICFGFVTNFLTTRGILGRSSFMVTRQCRIQISATTALISTPAHT